MGILSRWRTVAAVAADAPRRPQSSGLRFAIDQDAVPPEMFGLTSWDSSAWSGPAPRISRKAAMQVPGVKRARDIICQTIGGLPVEFLDAGNRVVEHPLLTQPERDIPRSITMINTIDDLLFEGVAVWRIVEVDGGGYPVKVRRLDAATIDLTRENKVYVKRDGTNQGTAWEWVPDDQIIRFYSPTDPLVEAGARAIRTAIALDAAASRYADDPMASGYFRATEGADPLVDEQGEDETDEEYEAREGNAIKALVTQWRAARRVSGTGYVPAGLEYVPLEWDPAQLQLAEGRQHAVLEISRTTGIDPEDLGVSTTSRTYANSTQKREELRDYTLAPFASAVTDRLSMEDITRQHYRARVNFRSFIEADELTRMQTYQAAITVGAYGTDEVQRREQLPHFVAATPPAAAETPGRPGRALRSVAAEADDVAVAFAAEPSVAIGFTEAQGIGFEVDVEARTIFGLVIPWGAVSGMNRGNRYRFASGTVELPADPSRVKLRLRHEGGTELAYATEFVDSPPGLRPGLWARFKVARTPAGDEALQMAADKVWDGLSAGLRAESIFDYSRVPGPVDAVRAILGEVSLTPDPSFTDSRVHTVTASTPDREDLDMPPTPAPPATDAPATPAPDVSRETAPAVTFSMEDLTAALTTALQNTAPRPVIAANGQPAGVALQVAEEPLYRFEGAISGEFDFARDLIAAGKDRNPAARERLDKFMELQFATATTDVNEINPTVYRPDMYVDQLDYTTPIWDAINKGTINEITPFSFAKWASSAGLVADHAEGVEPTVGSFVLTGDTVTPTALSGKMEINREVWDQVGNPSISGLVWNEIRRAYYEGLETASVTFLNALTPTGITITAGAADDDLDGELTAALAALHYIRGGYRMRDFFVQIDLYLKLIAAVDGNGRKLFPILNPTNADGSTSENFAAINVGGLAARPAWALAATGGVPASSYLFNRGDVWGWASAPRRLDFDYQVKSLFVGVWGYKAFRNTRAEGIREVIYDPTA